MTLEKLVFDKIEFQRNGFKNDNEIEFGFEIQIGQIKNKHTKVTVILKGNKEDEYSILISLSGFFSLSGGEEVDKELAETIFNSNAVAILMPYLRSELSLLTAQPDMDCIVLPPFNINKMLDSENQE